MPAIQDHINDGYSNRVADAIYLYAEQETQYRINHPHEKPNDPETIALKLQYYDSIYNAYRKTGNTYEKLSLHFVRNEMARMKARLNPTAVNRIFYSNIADSIRSFFNGKNLLYAKHKDAIKTIQHDLIRTHNLHAISAGMKKAGFKTEIEGTLQKMIAQDLPQFHIRYADIHYPKADFILHFKKIPQTELYYFEKFQAISRPSLDALLKNDPSCQRYTFSLQDKMNITANEAANLVNNKCIYRQIDGKETWLMLDNATPGGPSLHPVSFNLEKALERLPLKISPLQYQSLIQTLKAGNTKEVTLSINDHPVKYIIETAPQRNTIDVLDKQGQVIDTSNLFNNPGNSLTRQVVEKLRQQEDAGIDLGQRYRRKVRKG